MRRIHNKIYRIQDPVLRTTVYTLFALLDLFLFLAMIKCLIGYAKTGNPAAGLIAIPISLLFGLLNAPFVANYLGPKFVSFLYPEGRGEMPREYSKAKSLVVRRMYDEAIKEYRKALEEDPKDASAQQQIAEIYHEKLKDYERAILEYRKVLEMEPQEELWIFTINRIADIYSEKLKRPLMAEEELKRIISKHPGTKQALAAQRRMDRITHK